MSHTALPRSAPFLQQAMQRLQTEDYAGAEEILNTLLKEMPDDANALHLMGLVRLQQHHHEEAAPYLKRSIELSPRHALTRLNYGKVLVLMGQDEQAAESFREAIKLRHDMTEAHLELGNAMDRLGRPAEAEGPLRIAVQQAPGHALAKLSLGGMLIELNRFEEAEQILAAGLAQAGEDEELRAKFHNNLGLAQRALRKDAEALESFEKAQELAPYFIHLDMMRSGLLQNLHRLDEALATLEMILEREPQNVEAHYYYNSVLYRLGREDEFLKSYDRAGDASDILRAKGAMLVKAERNQEAHDVYAELVTRDPDDAHAQAGLGMMLSHLSRHGEAKAALEKAVKLMPNMPHYLGHLAGALIRGNEPEQAVKVAQHAMALEPMNQSHIALLGSAWRLMNDPRDEALMGYDTLIRTFEVETPKGWRDMDAFNQDLLAELDKLHPESREYLDQSLRKGTQTPDSLFGAGHELVEKLYDRITETVARYITEMNSQTDHPFLGRKRGGFRYAGSWSSRLRDCGYHTDHIHPEGWISSCYYVGVPDAVKDENEKQGWIKFGTPSVLPDMPMRRAIQPAPGRLVLFPSYMWHGTIPFRSATPRTTIAFDVLPD